MFAFLQRGPNASALALVAVLAWFPVSSSAQTCPFDNGGSDAVNDGLVLTRYALGITGAPLVASTRYASLDPLQVKNNIECVGCALDMNGDGQIDTVDTTIIARHLAGFKDASLTSGLALGVAPTASRPTTAAVVSFLASGCATGATGAFVKGGNSFGSAAVLGTNDAFDLKVASGGSKVSLEIGNGSGLRVIKLQTPIIPTHPRSSTAPSLTRRSARWLPWRAEAIQPATAMNLSMVHSPETVITASSVQAAPSPADIPTPSKRLILFLGE